MKKLLVCQECKRQWDVTRYETGQKLRCLCGFLMEVPLIQPQAPNVLHCESCGAPRKPSEAACEFCGATPTLLESQMTLICPFCFCRTADESRYCQSCGKVIQAAPLGPLTGQLSCPRCKKQKLANRTIGEFQTDECPLCGGIWVGAEAFERLVNQQAHEREEKDYSHQVRTSQLQDNAIGVVYIECPVCSKLMNRYNFAHASGVIIDECRVHGIWLDQGELHKIAEYVASGGLTRSKRIELAQLEEQHQRKAQPCSGPHAPGIFGEDSPSRNAVDYIDLGRTFVDAVGGFIGWLRKGH